MKHVQTRSVVLIATTILSAMQQRADAADEVSVPAVSYTVQAQVIAAGGTSMTGAHGLLLDGTIAEANSPTMTGPSGRSLASGFWPIEAQLDDRIFTSEFDVF